MNTASMIASRLIATALRRGNVLAATGSRSLASASSTSSSTSTKDKESKDTDKDSSKDAWEKLQGLN